MTSIVSVWLSFVAALIAAFITLLTTWLNNRYQLQREYQQWLRQQESDRQKWQRDELYDLYRKSTRFLTQFINLHNPDDFFERKQVYVELQEYLPILLVKLSKERTQEREIFQTLMANFFADWLNAGSTVEKLRTLILELMSSDPRLK